MQDCKQPTGKDTDDTEPSSSKRSGEPLEGSSIKKLCNVNPDNPKPSSREFIDLTTPPQLEQPSQINHTNLRQSKLNFRVATKEEAEEQSRKEHEAYLARSEAVKARIEEEKAAKQEKIRQQTAARVAKYRKKKKDKKNTTEKALELVPSSSSTSLPCGSSVAQASRDLSNAWKDRYTGKRGGRGKGEATRTNWFQPFLWAGINEIALKVHFSSTHIVDFLKKTNNTLYKGLNKGVVSRWIRPDKRGWTDAVLKNVVRKYAIAGSGRVGALTPYPEIVEEMKDTLTALRSKGIPVNAVIARSILLSIIEARNPDILNSRFKCSETYARNFLSSVMGMTFRRATRSAAHIPTNWEEVCERSFFRLVHVIKEFDIPPSLIVNMDQTGILYIPGYKSTYETTGSKQVEIVAKDEKRGWTLCVSSTADGTLLPFQQVCGGQTEKSTPNKNASGMQEAKSFGFDFTFAAGEKKRDSHYSTLKTMKEYMERVYIPYYHRILQENPELPQDQRSVLFLDCYPVHTGAEFLSYLRDTHPYVLPIFVPANCTGVFQPADVGLQRVIKHHLKHYTLMGMIHSHREQLARGIPLSETQFSNSVVVLRDSSVQALVSLWKFMTSKEGSQLVKMAWRKCAVKNWDLSYSTLTDVKTRAALRNYLAKDDTLRNEIARRTEQYTPDIPEHSTETPIAEEVIDDSCNDDTAVSVRSVIKNTFGLDLGSADQLGNTFCTNYEFIGTSDDPNYPGLVSSAKEEYIWSYTTDGIHWSDTVVDT